MIMHCDNESAMNIDCRKSCVSRAYQTYRGRLSFFTIQGYSLVTPYSLSYKQIADMFTLAKVLEKKDSISESLANPPFHGTRL